MLSSEATLHRQVAVERAFMMAASSGGFPAHKVDVTLIFEKVVEGAPWGETLMFMMGSGRRLQQGHQSRVLVDLPHSL